MGLPSNTNLLTDKIKTLKIQRPSVQNASNEYEITFFQMFPTKVHIKGLAGYLFRNQMDVAIRRSRTMELKI